MLKRIAIILMAVVLILTITACSKQDNEPVNKNSKLEYTVSETLGENEKNNKESDVITTVHSEKPTDNSNVSSETEAAEEVTTEKEKPVVTSAPSDKEETKAETENKPQTQVTENNKTEPEKPAPETTVMTEAIKIADRADVERKIAEYINGCRSTKATVLTGLSQVARYRSQELVTNFAHTDGTTACGALKYGEYVDLTEYGLDESQNYYIGYNREAIAKGKWVGSADEIALDIVQGFKNSANHWKYLGSSEYIYIAVGCTYDSATNYWYCCICVSSINYGG